MPLCCSLSIDEFYLLECISVGFSIECRAERVIRVVYHSEYCVRRIKQVDRHIATDSYPGLPLRIGRLLRAQLHICSDAYSREVPMHAM